MSWIISVKVMDTKHKYDPFFMYSEYLLDHRITRYDITTDLAVILTLYLPRSASWLTSVTSDVTCIYHIILGKLVLCLNDQLHCTWDLKRAPHAWPICKVEFKGFLFAWSWTNRQYPCCMYSLVKLNPMFISPSKLTRFIPLSYIGFILENYIGVVSVA